MKNVLLTTTALVAFAGAAVAAEVNLTYSGSAETGYNATNNPGVFYATAKVDIDMSLTQELNNGAVASLVLSGFADWDNGANVDFAPTWIAKVETSYGSIAAGDITNVTKDVFTEVAGMDVDIDGSADADDKTSTNVTFAGNTDHSVRVETALGGFAVAASTNAAHNDVSLTASGSAGAMDFVLLYETDAVGLNVSGAMGGVTFAVAYAANNVGGNTSTGLGLGYTLTDAISVSASFANNTGVQQTAAGVAYAAGGITASADYDIDGTELDLAAGYTTEISAGTTVTVGVALNDAGGTGDAGYSIDIAHVLGDLSVYAGYKVKAMVGTATTTTYAGVSYDLGGGASAFAYQSDAADLGPLDWDSGTKVGVKMTF